MSQARDTGKKQTTQNELWPKRKSALACGEKIGEKTKRENRRRDFESETLRERARAAEVIVVAAEGFQGSEIALQTEFFTDKVSYLLPLSPRLFLAATSCVPECV